MMIKDTLQSISGIEIFPIIALILFFVFFSMMLVWVFKLDKQVVKEMEQLPFESNEIDGER